MDEQRQLNMYSQGRVRSARNHYEGIALASQIEGASRHQLVVILYDHLLCTLETLARGISTQSNAVANAQRQRALSILHALSDGLDRANGGPLAAQLDHIYAQCSRNIGADCDVNQLREVIASITELATAWRAIGQGG
jgi:flagellar secretion chaperone FliS